MIPSTRALAAALIGSAFVASSWVFLFPHKLSADDEPKAARPAAADSPPRPAGGDPAIFLSRGGPERTGSVSGSHLPEHPALQWMTQTWGPPGEPLLADGVIYVGASQGVLYALQATDGDILWQIDNEAQIFEAPAARGGAVYFTSKNGLSAVAREHGSLLWNCKLVTDATESSPLIVNDRIIVADTGGNVSAVDFGGKLIWRHDIAADAPASPPGFDIKGARPAGGAARPRTAASDGTAVFLPIFDQSRLAVIDLRVGRRRWSFPAKGYLHGAPTVIDDRVFFGSQDRHLYCLDKRRKTPLWAFATGSRIEAGVAYRDGSVFFGSCDGRFYRVDAATGKEVWSYQTPRSPGAKTAIYSSPLCTEDAVYFGSCDGYLYRLKIADGELKWRFRPVEGAEITGSPLTDGRRIFLAIRQAAGGQGRDAIVAIGEEADRKRPG